MQKNSANTLFFLMKTLFQSSSNTILVTVLSSFILSPFGPKFLSFGGYIPEITIPLFVILSGSKIIYLIKLNIAKLLIASVLCSICLIIGVFSHWNFMSAYSDMRTILFFFFIFFLSQKANHQFQIYVLQICLINVILTFLYFFIFHDTFSSPKFGVSIFANLTLLSIFSSMKEKTNFTIFFILTMIVASISFYRSNLIITVLVSCIFIANLMITELLSKKTSIINILIENIFFAFVIILSLYIGSGYILQYFASDESKMIQSIKKFENLLGLISEGEQSGGGDKERISLYQDLFANINNFLLPHGFGNDAFQKNLDTQYNLLDSSYYYLIFTFGLILFALAFTSYLLKFIHSINLKKTMNFNELILTFSLLMYFFIAAEVFTVLERSFFAAFIFGNSLNVNSFSSNFSDKKNVK